MLRIFQWFYGFFILALLIGGPLAYLTYRHTVSRNFHTVWEGKLYRSGKLSPGILEQVTAEYGIRTVINFRDVDRPGDPTPDPEEEKFCLDHGIDYIRIKPKHWKAGEDGTIAAQKNVDQVLRLLDDPRNYPFWIHCFAGEHRTGAYAAVIRMEYDHWSNQQAIEEMKRLGYRKFDSEEDVRLYLMNYVPRWKNLSTTE